MEKLKQLYEDLPEEAIQRTKKEQTKKGYNTTGYSYQYCVDHFNEAFDDQWGFVWDMMDHTKGAYKSGQAFHEVTVRIGIWVEDKTNVRECVGGHTSSNFHDALKGAITNGFKKTAAFWGVGARAFRGAIDDDHSVPDSDSNKTYDSKPKGKSKGDLVRAVEMIEKQDDAGKLRGLLNYFNGWTWTTAETEEIKSKLALKSSELQGTLPEFDDQTPLGSDDDLFDAMETSGVAPNNHG